MEENIIYEKDFPIYLTENSRDMVFHLLNCQKTSHIFDDYLTEYEEIKEEALSLLHCEAVASFSQLEVDMGHLKHGEEVLCSIFTIGKRISGKSQEYFDQGDYVKAMLLDAIADVSVFQGEEAFLQRLKKECQQRKFGISGRYEAPTHIPMEFQQFAFEQTKADAYLSMELSSGLMLNPVKSSCQCLTLSKKIGEFHLDHDCSACTNFLCSLRSSPPYSVTMKDNNGTAWETVLCKESQSILDLLREKNVIAPCGGKGTCGKCQVEILSGNIPISDTDRRFFNKKQLDDGFRLACRAYPSSPCILLYPKDQSTIEKKEILQNGGFSSPNQVGTVKIAIDLGTTTLVFALTQGKKKLNDLSIPNPQKNYGADVVSRIQASNQGNGKALQLCIQKVIWEGITMLLNNGKIPFSQVNTVIFSGNTTMLHLLLGYSCQSLGCMPFTPVDISLKKLSLGEVLLDTTGENLVNCSAVLLPSISTFVGGDIVSGIFATEMYLLEENSLLVDLGTNGEMVLGNSQGFFVTSTALGPACEGGNITWGMTATEGAISSILIEKTDKVHVRYETIGDKSPVGICGSGVLEAISQMLDNEIIDETGRISEEFREIGYPLALTEKGETINLTQKDVREVQLVKAAVRAGIETLLSEKKISYQDVSTVFVTGGFGFHLNFEKIVSLGLFPLEFLGKFKMVENASLLGAELFEIEESSTICNKIVSVCEEIPLGTNQIFQENFIEFMNFEKE